MCSRTRAGALAPKRQRAKVTRRRAQQWDAGFPPRPSPASWCLKLRLFDRAKLVHCSLNDSDRIRRRVHRCHLVCTPVASTRVERQGAAGSVRWSAHCVKIAGHCGIGVGVTPEIRHERASGALRCAYCVGIGIGPSGALSEVSAGHIRADGWPSHRSRPPAGLRRIIERRWQRLARWHCISIRTDGRGNLIEFHCTELFTTS